VHLRNRIFAFISATSLLAGMTFQPSSADDDLTLGGPVVQPNVVMVITDDQTWQQRKAMPRTMEWFASHGTIFRNTFVNLPWCCPSRATMITGQYAMHHGVWTLTPPYGGYTKLDNTNTLPVWMRKAGYRTGYIGKYLNGLPLGEIPPGYTDWQAIYGSALPYYGFTINDNGVIINYPAEKGAYLTDVLANRTVATIGEMSASGAPFFLTVGVTAPHVTVKNAPPVPADRHIGAYKGVPMPRRPGFNEADVSDKPNYVRSRSMLTNRQIASIGTRWRREMESLMSVDDLIVRTIETLRIKGELDHTILVFVSDNGFMHGEHRIPGDKRVPYRESVHVPMMFSGPGFPPGQVVDTAASNIDIAPTIVSAAGATAGRVTDGIALQTAIANPSTVVSRKILIERYDANCYQGLVSRNWWYVRYVTGEEELYSKEGQLVNEIKWEIRAGVVTKLRKQLDTMTGGTPLAWCEH
jgi:arylsulfatase A-like enzyme